MQQRRYLFRTTLLVSAVSLAMLGAAAVHAAKPAKD